MPRTARPIATVPAPEQDCLRCGRVRSFILRWERWRWTEGEQTPAFGRLELRDGNGVLILANNNWRDNQETALQNTHWCLVRFQQDRDQDRFRGRAGRDCKATRKSPDSD